MTPPRPPDCYITVPSSGHSIRTRYWRLGDDHAAAGTLLLIHGLGAYIENWEWNIGPLAQQYRVIALDLVGYGRSDKPPLDYSSETLSRFLADFMVALGLERATLVGHSMGGGLALHFQLRYPARVERLVLVSSAGFGRKLALPFRLITLPLVGEYLVRPTRASSARALKTLVHDPALVTEAAIDLDYELSSLPGAQLPTLRIIRGAATLFGVRQAALAPLWEHMPHIAAPTLVIWGRQDAIVPVEYAEVARQRIPGCQAAIFDRCGHLPMWEQPEQFNRRVLEFMQDSG